MAKEEKNVRRKRRGLNIVDWILIAALLLCGVGVYLRYGKGKTPISQSDLTDAKLYFSLSDVSPSAYDGFAEGSEAYNGDGVLLGTVAGRDEFSVGPAKYYVTTRTGEIAEMYTTGTNVDINGVLNCRGVFSEYGYLINGKTCVAPGQTLLLKTKELTATVLITDVIETAP